MSISINLFFLLEQSKGGFYIITQFWTWEYSRGVLFSCCMLRNSTLLKYPSPAIASSSNYVLVIIFRVWGVCSRLYVCYGVESVFFLCVVLCSPPPFVMVGWGVRIIYDTPPFILFFFLYWFSSFCASPLPWWWGVSRGFSPSQFIPLFILFFISGLQV